VPCAQIDQPAADSAQFDSDALWAVVHGQVQPGHRLLMVRGDSACAPSGLGEGSGREWLQQCCLAAGGQVESVAVYRRQAPQWSVSQCESARQAAHDGSQWLISSSEALANLQYLCPSQDWSHARALVTHPRIAQAAQAMGFGEIITTRPALADVLQALSTAP
jgi:uroporphyrinogen-III synthase